MALRHFLHQARRWPIWDLLHGIVPPRILLGAEIRPRENLLHAHYLHTLASGLLEQLQMLLDVRFANLCERLIGRARVRRLNQATLNDTGHPALSLWF